MLLAVVAWCSVSSEVHMVQKQLTQAENDNAALRTDKGKLETKAGQLVHISVTATAAAAAASLFV